MTIIPPFNDENVIAGQSTCAQEIFEDAGPLDILLVCVGGGGLISGSALAKRKLSPNCQIIGVEPATGNDVQLSLEQGKIVTIEVPDTIADGQQTTAPGEKTFEIMNELVHSIVTVTDNEIVTAMDYLFRFQKLVIEPSGASAMAALLSNKIDCTGKKIGVTLSGGNIDPARFSHLMSTHNLIRL
jgi:threonine dehydratase